MLHRCSSGLKVIMRGWRVPAARRAGSGPPDARLKRGERVCARVTRRRREICTGDHSCIRLSGCPSSDRQADPDPLRTDR